MPHQDQNFPIDPIAAERMGVPFGRRDDPLADQPTQASPLAEMLSELQRLQQPQPRPERATKDLVKEFTSDLMFTLAHSLGAAASLPGERGTLAGIATAISGPATRKSLIEQQEEAERARHEEQLIKMIKLQSELESTQLETEERRQKMRMAGVYELPNGEIVKVDPLHYGVTTLRERQEERPPLITGTREGRQVRIPDIPGQDIGPAPVERQPDRTPEESFIDLALQEAIAGNQGDPLTPTREKTVRQEARREWMSLARDPELSEVNQRLRELQVQAAEQRTQGSGTLNPQQLSQALSMSSQLKSHPAYTDMLDINTGMQGVQVGLAEENGFGDIAAINAFQRMIDPGATVREGDVGLLQSASSFIDRVLSDYPVERLRKGDRLPQAVRDRMLRTAGQLYQVRARNYNDTVGRQFRSLAGAAGVPFELIGSDFEVSAPASPGPAVPEGQWRIVPD